MENTSLPASFIRCQQLTVSQTDFAWGDGHRRSVQMFYQVVYLKAVWLCEPMLPNKFN